MPAPTKRRWRDVWPRRRAEAWSRPAIVALAALSACAPKVPVLPAGAGSPFPSYAAAYARATASCRDVRTYTAVMALSGKAGRTKLRGRVEAGFAAPGRLRLEGVAPFGRPVFVLTADGARGTLVLPREDQVLQNVAAEDIVEALAGVPLGADALRTAVSGCGLEAGAAPTDGRSYPDGRAAIVFPGGTAYLKQDAALGRRSPGEGGYTLIAATRGGVTVFYDEVANGRPSAVRLLVEQNGRATADLTLRLTQVEINTTIDPRAFTPDLPAHPVPITLDELRRAGPLGS